MSAAGLVCISHSPLIGYTPLAPELTAQVDQAFQDARDFIARFEPDLVVLFAPDHYNGFFYDMMPSFCVGAAATSIGDYDSPAGSLSVDRDAAYALVRGALAEDVDVTVSERMYVDHGFAQPLQLLFGGLDKVPVVPVFINSIAVPLGPVSRSRRLGAALGRSALALDRRVLFLGSGGLSHDPPTPTLDGADPDVEARLISEGRHMTPHQRAARQLRTINAGRDFAHGQSTMQPLNPEWDRLVLQTLADGTLEQVDGWSTDWFTRQGGHAAHEVRTWIAAHAALSAAGPYETTDSFYAPIPEWIVGFAMSCALPHVAKATVTATAGAGTARTGGSAVGAR